MRKLPFILPRRLNNIGYTFIAILAAMSKIIRALVLCLLIVASLSASAQSKHPVYTVNNTIVSEIDRKIEPFQGKYNANLSFVVYEDAKEVIKRDNKPALSFTSFSNNIVAVDCLNGTNDGFGFFLMIGKDTSFINFKVLSKSDSILFRSANASALQPELLVNCASSKVTLAQAPTFVQGEVIQGFVDLESEPFYEVRNDKERKVSFRIVAYFKSEPTPVNKNQYKTLSK